MVPLPSRPANSSVGELVGLGSGVALAVEVGADVVVGPGELAAPKGDVAGRACGWPQATPIKRRPRISRRMTHQRRAGAERYWSSGFRGPGPFRRVVPRLMQLVGSHIPRGPPSALLPGPTIAWNPLRC